MTMIVGNPEKVSTLICALEARYRALEAIVARARAVCVWSLATVLAAAGWVVWAGAVLADDQTVILCLAALVGWLALRFGLLPAWRREAAMQRQQAVGLEGLLGLREPGRFGPDSPPALPEAPRAAGAVGQGMVDVGFAVLVVAILSRGDSIRAWAHAALKALNL
jgi:hypothetical protein